MDTLDNLHIKTCLFVDESQAIQSIRTTVFQEEQGIPQALEWDGLDEKSIHIVAKVNHEIVGVARVREIEEALTLKLERLAVLAPYRHRGIGSEIVYSAIAYSKGQGYGQLKIHAQVPTIGFYEQLGFRAVGASFLEAGIEHFKMERQL